MIGKGRERTRAYRRPEQSDTNQDIGQSKGAEVLPAEHAKSNGGGSWMDAQEKGSDNSNWCSCTAAASNLEKREMELHSRTDGNCGPLSNHHPQDQVGARFQPHCRYVAHISVLRKQDLEGGAVIT